MNILNLLKQLTLDSPRPVEEEVETRYESESEEEESESEEEESQRMGIVIFVYWLVLIDAASMERLIQVCSHQFVEILCMIQVR